MNETPMTSTQPAASPIPGIATASMVLGILGVTCFSILAGLPALVLGIIALVKIGGSGGRLRGMGVAIAGVVLGGLSFALLPIVAALLLPAAASARGRAQEVACMNKVKQLSLGVRLYAEDHDGRFPDRWEDLYEYLGGSEAAEKILACPADPDRDAGSSYELVNPGSLFPEIANPGTTAVVREVVPNHRGKRVAGYADGHSEAVTGTD